MFPSILLTFLPSCLQYYKSSTVYCLTPIVFNLPFSTILLAILSPILQVILSHTQCVPFYSTLKKRLVTSQLATGKSLTFFTVILSFLPVLQRSSPRTRIPAVLHTQRRVLRSAYYFCRSCYLPVRIPVFLLPSFLSSCLFCSLMIAQVSLMRFSVNQGVTKRCRLSLATNSALVYESQ